MPPDHQPLEDDPHPLAANGNLYYANNIFDILVFRNTSRTAKIGAAT